MSEIALDWIKALRSGEYKQGKLILFSQTKNTYCCLGVFQDILEKKGLCPPLERHQAFLRGVALDIFEKIFGDNFMFQCSSWNDVLSLTFDEIAKLIEDKLNELNSRVGESIA